MTTIREQVLAVLAQIEHADWRTRRGVLADALYEAEQRGWAEVAAEIEKLTAQWERSAHRAEQDGEAVAAAVTRHRAAQLHAFLAGVTP